MSEEFQKYKEGDLYPALGKRVEMLIMSTNEFFVFLDEDLFVQWETTPDFETAAASEILNKVSYLETISMTHFSADARQRGEIAEFRRLLGESLARAFDGNLVSANKLLRASEALLRERSIQRARVWYLTAAGAATLVPLAGLFAAVTLQGFLKQNLGEVVFEVAISGLLGGVGAFVSTVFSVRRLSLNASVGPRLHYIEGAARVVTGLVGGALVALAIKGNLFLGAINSMADSQARFAAICACAIVAGASERWVPSLIKKIESTALDESRDLSKPE